jgi:hypothetical protein
MNQNVDGDKRKLRKPSVFALSRAQWLLGNVAEIEFDRGGFRMIGTGYGTPGSWKNREATFWKALDTDINTYFDGPTADGNYVGIDTGTANSIVRLLRKPIR